MSEPIASPPTATPSRRVLVAMAHADDMEFHAGGTVAKLVEQGYEAVLVLLGANIAGGDINGDGDYMHHRPEAVKPIRDAETDAGARELGVRTVVQMGFKDAVYFNGKRITWLGDPDYDVHAAWGAEPLPAAAVNPRCIERMQKILERYTPEVVITHNFYSGFEHTCAAQIVAQAFAMAVKNGTALGSLWAAAHVRPGAWECDVRLFPSPNVLIDVTDHWTRKLRAIRAHRSQNVEANVKKMEVIGRYWGIAAQCRYAEPFTVLYDARYR